jgi:hypothetical protein
MLNCTGLKFLEYRKLLSYEIIMYSHAIIKLLSETLTNSEFRLRIQMTQIGTLKRQNVPCIHRCYYQRH